MHFHLVNSNSLPHTSRCISALKTRFFSINFKASRLFQTHNVFFCGPGKCDKYCHQSDTNIASVFEINGHKIKQNVDKKKVLSYMRELCFVL